MSYYLNVSQPFSLLQVYLSETLSVIVLIYNLFVIFPVLSVAHVTDLRNTEASVFLLLSFVVQNSDPTVSQQFTSVTLRVLYFKLWRLFSGTVLIHSIQAYSYLQIRCVLTQII